MTYLNRTPNFIRNIFPGFVWRIPTDEKVIYLTFDDGPVPEVTEFVLDTLEDYGALATFFCVGDNVRQHPFVYRKIVEQGHSIGSHTYNHISGWGTDNLKYFHNVRHAATTVQSSLFRPPYGRIKPNQANFLLRHYNIIMWDVLSGDFNIRLDGQTCFENVRDNAIPGSIVVFHDSVKALPRLQEALPKTLAYFSSLGYRFERITEELLANKSPDQRKLKAV